MRRRVHIPRLTPGESVLPQQQAVHLRDVLRLGVGDVVEAFDDDGALAEATIAAAGPGVMTLLIGAVSAAKRPRFAWTIAAATPKGPRADWMVEKLSELGAAAFIPLVTARGVVMPSGKEKAERWARLAAEAARQSGRPGVMRIEPLTSVGNLVGRSAEYQSRWYFSTRREAAAVRELTVSPPPVSLLMLVGPEGGWTEPEIESFDAGGLTAVRLTGTTLRIETAAIAAAAVAGTWEAEI